MADSRSHRVLLLLHRLYILWSLSRMNVYNMRKPYILVLISQKLTLHLKDLNMPYFLKIVAHFQACFEAVSIVVLGFQQFETVWHRLIRCVVYRVTLVNNWCSELVFNRFTNAKLFLDTSLYELNLLPVTVFDPCLAEKPT
jgi:hypothetical protein